MELHQQRVSAFGIRFSLSDSQGNEIGRAYLYILSNDLHGEPFGFLEDVFVEEDARNLGAGTELLQAVIATARDEGCYKLVGTSRESRSHVHDWYRNLGFREQGREFRMDFPSAKEG